MSISLNTFARPLAAPFAAAPMTYARPQSVLYAPFEGKPLAEMPDPGTIDTQKQGFLMEIEQQTSMGAGAMSAECNNRKAAIRNAADAQKAQFNAQVDAEVQQQFNLLDQQYQKEMLILQQRAATQKSALEQQALQQTMKYQQTFNFVELQKQQAAMEAQRVGLLNQQTEEMARLQQEQMALAAQYQQISQPVVMVMGR